jgi:hypothetical protein
MAENNVPKLERYRYGIDLNLAFNESEEPVNITQFVTDIRLHYNYLIHIFPIIQIGMLLEKPIANQIKDGADQVRFILNVDKYLENDIGAEKEPLPIQFIKNKILKPMDLDRRPVRINENIQMEISKQTDDLVQCDMFFFYEDSLNLLRKLVSGVLINVDIKNTILFGLNKLYSGGNVFLCEPDNTTKYEQIIIPPSNISEFLRNLNDIYGIYKSGIRFFFDLEKCFIIPGDLNNRKLPIAEDEYDTVFIDVVESSKARLEFIGCFKDDEEERYHIRTIDDGVALQLKVNDNSNRELFGELITFVSSMENSHSEFHTENNTIGATNRTLPDMTNIKEPKNRILLNRYGHEFAESEFLARSARSTTLLKILFSTIDMDLITPNRKYVIHFEDEKFAQDFDGIYLLAEKIYTIIKGSQDKLGNIIGIAYFQKLPKDILS